VKLPGVLLLYICLGTIIIQRLGSRRLVLKNTTAIANISLNPRRPIILWFTKCREKVVQLGYPSPAYYLMARCPSGAVIMSRPNRSRYSWVNGFALLAMEEGSSPTDSIRYFGVKSPKARWWESSSVVLAFTLILQVPLVFRSYPPSSSS